MRTSELTKGMQVVGFCPTVAPNPTCCSNPSVLCVACAREALAGYTGNRLTANWDKRSQSVKNFYEPESDPKFNEDDFLSLPENAVAENEEDTGIPARAIECSNCGGSGEINTDVDGTMKLLPCPVCDGSGAISTVGEQVEDRLSGNILEDDTLELPTMDFLEQRSEKRTIATGLREEDDILPLPM